ncbi:hypothetical protein Lal_00003862 [Lupinus albus]|nr:hypothetical protein Lal_00003862 [Lupinus albus]
MNHVIDTAENDDEPCFTATDASPLHIAIYPWFSMEHLTQYLHFSNKLGKGGHSPKEHTPSYSISTSTHTL